MAKIDPEGPVVQGILHDLIDPERYLDLVEEALHQVEYDIDYAILVEFVKRCKAAGIEADTALRDYAETWFREAATDGEALLQEYLRNALRVAVPADRTEELRMMVDAFNEKLVAGTRAGFEITVFSKVVPLDGPRNPDGNYPHLIGLMVTKGEDSAVIDPRDKRGGK